MIKWIFVIIVGLGAYMHFTSKTKEIPSTPEAGETITYTPPTQQPDLQAAQRSHSREPTEEQCKSHGGRIISGMGCVVGAPEGNVNPTISASEMEAICKSDNTRYEPALNACISNYNP